MAGGRVYSGGASSSSLSVLLQNQRGPCASEPLDSLFLSGSSNSSSASPFLGSRSMVSFEDVREEMDRIGHCSTSMSTKTMGTTTWMSISINLERRGG
ncbi:homeobox-leucine zipper protein HAT5-like [Prunus yedoensis var. nudiflora]|uniref:Homeobox-leucine zipper protein HAT5-like n=1 Tax=Prunus yedoensis var. nudiflora TaxID=2094558 RepID=A0A314YA73_PRUYE|nr:homeobox-leucine zipper protein HAT5-like [Prunus yedoensis var. nudiflora]